ncbi:MAG: threonylcarbamoyl-AMP synthase [Hyphomonadaceae bacterium]|jgi:L-threonylcarbamoyladenylate synthase|nr:threonylcarbamoyl-AMP synthase [Hyphomonadaceae bacterium]
MNSDSHNASRDPARIVGVDASSLDEAARILLAGGLVAVPTETVYGVAADATNGAAVAAIFTAKGRPSFNPLICHVASVAMAESLADFTPLARRLAERFWPGPLTLVLPRKPDCPVHDLATAGLPSIGLRIPQHIATLEIISRVGRPLAAPSANPSEQLSPTTAAHVATGLGPRIDLIVDGGAAIAGVESTIIAPGESHAVMLRPGAIARSDIELLTGPLRSPEASEGILAPGMMKRHYAPRARLRMDASHAESGEAFLAFGSPPPGVLPSLNLSIRGDLIEAASNLFAMLRTLDESHAMIAVQTIPETGLGEAINDRLRRGTLLSRESGV